MDPPPMLMPVSATFFAAALLLRGVETAVGAAAVGLAWAIKNWVVGPLKGDAGILTFSLYLAAVLLGWKERARAGSAFILAANFGVPFLMALATKDSKASRLLRKNEEWVRIFKVYLGMSAAYWAYVGILHLRASEK